MIGDGIGGILTRDCTCDAMSPNTESDINDGNSVVVSSTSSAIMEESDARCVTPRLDSPC
jgi:hypothetical protein